MTWPRRSSSATSPAGGRRSPGPAVPSRRSSPGGRAWPPAIETARLSPLHWRSRTRLDEYAAAAVQLELAVRNARVLARSAIRAVETTADVPAELVAAVRKLADAVREVEPALELRDRSAPIESALAATTLASRAIEARSGARLRPRRRPDPLDHDRPAARARRRPERRRRARPPRRRARVLSRCRPAASRRHGCTRDPSGGSRARSRPSRGCTRSGAL